MNLKPVAYTIHFFSIIALATILVSSCSLLTFLEITDIELDHSSKTLSIGEKFQLSADITPSDAAETDINWSSSAPETVSVSGVGMLQALSLGEAVITAVSSTDDQIEAECVVTVKASVNYDVNGAESGQPPVDSELYAIGDKVTVKELPDDSGLPRTNYKFKNWNTSSDGSGTSCEAGDTLEVTKNSGNINVYAQWIRLEDPGVSIAFANPDNPDINFSGTYPEVNMGSTFTVSASLESAGYTWYLDGDKQTITDTSSPISQAGDTLQSVSIDTSGLSIGTHTITVITEENYSSSFSFTVISDISEPDDI